MVLQWLRTNQVASWMLVVLRIYLGVLWLESGWHKITSGFDASGFLNNAIKNPVVNNATKETLYPNFLLFLKHVALPASDLINILVPYGELLVGLGLILGALTTTAAFFGLLMNFLFLFAGTVSSNPWYILIQLVILVAVSNAGKIGVDYFLLPQIKKIITQRQTSKAQKV